jgi:hypothetical protein
MDMRASESHASLVIGWVLEQQALSGPLFRGEHHYQGTKGTKQKSSGLPLPLLGVLRVLVVMFSVRTHNPVRRPKAEPCTLIPEP